MPPRALAKWRREAYLPKEPIGGRTGFDGDVETGAAGRGAAGLVKSGTIVIGNDYEYAYAA